MATNHTPEESARRIIREGRRLFQWVSGEEQPIQGLSSDWLSLEWGDEDWDAGTDYGQKTGWFELSTTKHSHTLMYRLTDAGAATLEEE